MKFETPCISSDSYLIQRIMSLEILGTRVLNYECNVHKIVPRFSTFHFVAHHGNMLGSPVGKIMIQPGSRCKSMASSDPMNFLISKAINIECWFQDRLILRVLIKNSWRHWNFMVEQQRIRDLQYRFCLSIYWCGGRRGFNWNHETGNVVGIGGNKWNLIGIWYSQTLY